MAVLVWTNSSVWFHLCLQLDSVHHHHDETSCEKIATRQTCSHKTTCLHCSGSLLTIWAGLGGRAGRNYLRCKSDVCLPSHLQRLCGCSRDFDFHCARPSLEGMPCGVAVLGCDKIYLIIDCSVFTFGREKKRLSPENVRSRGIVKYANFTSFELQSEH